MFSNPDPLNGIGEDPVANFDAGNSLLIQRITSPWHAASVTWVYQPATTEVIQVVVPHIREDFLDVVDLDVTDLVRSMSVANENNGFLIRLQNEIA